MSQKKIKHPSLKKGFSYLSIAIILLLIGFMAGFGEGVNYAFDKGTYAMQIMFNVTLTGKAKNIIQGFPDLMQRIDWETREKLGLNTEEYKQAELDKLNQTMSMMLKLQRGW